MEETGGISTRKRNYLHNMVLVLHSRQYPVFALAFRALSFPGFYTSSDFLILRCSSFTAILFTTSLSAAFIISTLSVNSSLEICQSPIGLMM